MNTFDKFCAGILGAMTGYMAYGFIRYYVLGRRESVGAVKKRKIFAELSTAQRYIEDIGVPFYQLTDEDKRVLRDLANQFGYTGSKKSTKTIEEQYFNSLKRAYNMVSGVGSTNLPHETYRVKNGRGDVVIEYNDYGTESEIYRDAVYDYEEASYLHPDMAAILYIAQGGKFLWSSKKNKKKAGLEYVDTIKNSGGVKEMCFATRGKAADERKERMSYLSKNGLTPEMVAHQIWERWDCVGDTSEILDGILDVLRSVTSVGEAQKIIVDFYLYRHQVQEYPDGYVPNEELPF